MEIKNQIIFLEITNEIYSKIISDNVDIYEDMKIARVISNHGKRFLKLLRKIEDDYV